MKTFSVQANKLVKTTAMTEEYVALLLKISYCI